MADPKDVRAPRTNVFGSKSGGAVSFEVYFLRDLYAKGKIDDTLIRDVVKQNKLDDSHVDDAINALKSPSGDAVPQGLAKFLGQLAESIAGSN